MSLYAIPFHVLENRGIFQSIPYGHTCTCHHNLNNKFMAAFHDLCRLHKFFGTLKLKGRKMILVALQYLFFSNHVEGTHTILYEIRDGSRASSAPHL